MKIGIIGSGMIGATTARLFARAGHDVAISNSRGPEALSGLVAEIGPRVRAASVDEAAGYGEIVLVAIPFGRYNTLPADRLAGKIVVDAMNYYPQRDGTIDLHGLGSSELVARHLPGARLVKAFNTMYFRTLETAGNPTAPADERLALFVAGDDAAARAAVARLIDEIGFVPMDTGSLHDGGRKQEPGSPIYNNPLTGAQARAALDV
jgi:predicted dinucleotide-binding enzyme